MIYKISPNPSFPKRGIHRKASRTKKLKIDDIVYGLYEVTEEEGRIIEGK
ncbi:hypothetical protein HY772_07880 [Candidatus Woesearchaeota archaeon]|nr:hypothetical protein [Candidatus Woesearchaeota archaeon]